MLFLMHLFSVNIPDIYCPTLVVRYTDREHYSLLRKANRDTYCCGLNRHRGRFFLQDLTFEFSASKSQPYQAKKPLQCQLRNWRKEGTFLSRLSYSGASGGSINSGIHLDTATAVAISETEMIGLAMTDVQYCAQSQGLFL